MHYGEALVVHVPPEDTSADEGVWHVLSVTWLISYALAHPDSRQHTVHALDCFMFPSSALDRMTPTPPSALTDALLCAIRESSEDNARRAVRAIRRARVFSVTHYEEAADTAAGYLGLPIPEVEGA